ncbi:MAG TPA: hypothetical protein VJS18_21110 [Paraburkholderia sp.]|nr:hypothetical protein [Paraburkholderia sp.]
MEVETPLRGPSIADEIRRQLEARTAHVAGGPVDAEWVQVADPLPSEPAAAGAPVSIPHVTPAASAPSKPPVARPRLSRATWLKNELAAEKLRAKCERRAKQGVAKRGERACSGERLAFLTERRAIARVVLEGRVATARRAWADLRTNPSTVVYAIAIKRLCDARGWTLADMAARRRLAALLFLLQAAVPMCWNGRFARRATPKAQRSGRLQPLSNVMGYRERKYGTCVRGVGQGFLRRVIAWAGDTPDDSRTVNRATVRECMEDLAEFGALSFYRVPKHAADPMEIGDSGYVMHRYWLHGRDPKPALRGVYDAAGELLWVDVLDAPWAGAKPAESPPPS